MDRQNLTRRDLVRSAAAAPLAFALPARADPETGPAPGNDFYRYANAAELDAMTIPPDRWDYGQTDVAGARVQGQLEQIIRAAAARPAPRSDEEARVSLAFRALLDDAALERTALPVLKRALAPIANARAHDELAVLMADPRSSSLVAFNVFPIQGAWMPYLDGQNHNQPALGLPAWSYSADDANGVATRTAYARLIAELLALAGFDDSARRAADVVAVETEIAKRQWPLEKIRDRRANLHVMTLVELEAFAPGLPWRAMLDARGLHGVRQLNLGTDSQIAALAQLFGEKPLDSWRSWLAFSWIRNAVDALPPQFRDAHWRFVANGRDIGRPSREAEAIRFVIQRLPMEVGKLYTRACTPAGTREQADLLVRYLKRAMSERLRTTTWLDDASRTEALAKLDAMRLKAVAPRSLPAWRGPPLRADDALGNLDRLTRRNWAVQLERLTRPEAREEIWYQAPHIVDASYSVLFNAIEIPAAILQPPYFSANGDAAANFGAIGAIVGHEVGHAFDDQGVRYDSHGVLRDWMPATAQASFAANAQRLIAQYEGFEPLPGLRLNGRRTLGENVADLSGVSLALRAFELYRADHPDRSRQRRSEFRAFFCSWARIWCYKAPDSAIRHIIANSYYVPAPYRVNGVVRNVDAWYDAFDVRPGDALYLPPAARVRLW